MLWWSQTFNLIWRRYANSDIYLSNCIIDVFFFLVCFPSQAVIVPLASTPVFSVFCCTPFLIRTSNFGVEAHCSYILVRFEAENIPKMFFNLHGIQYFNKLKLREYN